MNLYDMVNESTEWLAARIQNKPFAAIALGSGLNDIFDELEVEASFRYDEIPNFPTPSVKGHKGLLNFYKTNGYIIAALTGRVHQYEGIPLATVTLPIRVLKKLGAELLVLTCATGGLNQAYKNGQIVIIKDHINLMGDNPLVGINDARLGTQHPLMNETYNRELINLALTSAQKLKIKTHLGVLAAMLGPSLETPAEYKMLKLIGADIVSMSTVPEAIIAAQIGFKTLGIGVVTNDASQDKPEDTSHEEVLRLASSASEDLKRLIIATLEAYT